MHPQWRGAHLTFRHCGGMSEGLSVLNAVQYLGIGEAWNGPIDLGDTSLNGTAEIRWYPPAGRHTRGARPLLR